MSLSVVKYIDRQKKYVILFFVLIFFFDYRALSQNLFGENFSARQLYFYGASTLLLLFSGIAIIFNRVRFTASFNRLDIAIFLFFLWSFIRLVFTPETPLCNERIIETSLLVFLYFVCKILFRQSPDDPQSYLNLQKLILAIFLCTGLNQAMNGISQSYSFNFENIVLTRSNIKAVGTFENPDYYAGYLSMFLPLSYGLTQFIPKKNRNNNALWYLGYITFLSCVFVLPSTLSRASWIAALFGITMIIVKRWNIFFKLKIFLKNQIFYLVLYIGLFIFIVALVFTLHNLKPDSANGRLLIWKITLGMIANNPIGGIGYDRYKVEYENCQADYFANPVRSDDNGSGYVEKIAGHVLNAYNEPLQIFAELGAVGFILFGSIIWCAIFSQNNHEWSNYPLFYSARASIIAFIVYSCFSYPMSILPTFINFFFLLAVVSANITLSYKVSIALPLVIQKVLAVVLVSLSLFLGWHTSMLYDGYRDWHSAYIATKCVDLKDAHDLYQKLHATFKNNGKFLFMYGGVLALENKHDIAIPILEEAKITYNDPNLWISLGQCYEKTEKYEIAQQHYQKASNIIPHKFYPKYLLLKMYIKTGKIEDAILQGNKFITMEEKVQSPALLEMKNEIRKIISK